MTSANKKIVHTVFDATAETFPQNIAIQYGDKQISYADLRRLSDETAALLKQAGVGRNTIVGILVPSGIAYVTAILGVMKAGGIFLPVDLSLPDKRLAYILEKTIPRVIIATDPFTPAETRLASVGFDTESIPVVIMGTDLRPGLVRDADAKARVPATAPTAKPATPDPDDSCYIMYTSGSTGAPKAIEGCYKSLSHFVHWEVQAFNLDDQCRVTQLAPVTFDASLRDIFVPLITGGRLCIPDPAIRTDPPALVHWLNTAGITLIHCVPSFFRVITHEIEAIRSGEPVVPALDYILMAGEPLYGKDVIRWMDCLGQRVTLVNLYGPSETTLIKTFHPIDQRPADPNAMIPVGQPIANTAILIIKANRLCEPGQIGEIFIKTPFRTKGYYQDPELTRSCFVPNPLSEDPQDIVYKTGDMGRYLPDRGIEFIGRLDSQVKVNGIRIELGEVEKTLLAHPCIDQAVVIGQRSPDNEIILVCYYTAKTPPKSGTDANPGTNPGVNIDADRISAWLHNLLPAYMVPSFFVHLQAFPLNINGKIDKKALPKPEAFLYRETVYAPPANETEAALAGIWAQVLHLNKVGVDSPFFRIGGHSLSAIRVLSRIYREMGVEISLKDFFTNPTVRGLAGLLSKTGAAGYAPIPPLAPQADYALSPSQRRLWMLDCMEEQSVAYSLPGLVEVRGDFDATVFDRALATLMARHESLRTTFTATPDGPRQVVAAPPGETAPSRMKILDWRRVPDAHQRIGPYARQQAAVPFDLATGPLLRVTVIMLSDDCHAIFFNLHHIIGDAWSLDILAGEVWSLYDAYRRKQEIDLPPLPIQYRDYAAWLNTRLETDETRSLSAYWHAKLAGAQTAGLDLPLDFTRPRLRTYAGRNIAFTLAKPETAALEALARQHAASMFMIMLALVKVLLYRYTGQSDIIVGSPMAGRNHPDLEGQIGFFANTLALRDRIAADAAFTAVLQQVKQTTIEAFDHQDYPFDRLVDELELARDPGRAPLFDVMLVFREAEAAGVPPQHLTITPVSIEPETSRFDLTFEIASTADGLQGIINYNSDLFKEETVAAMAGHLKTLARSVLTDANTAVGHLDMLTPHEKRLLRETFNDTQVCYPAEQTLVDLFEVQAARCPDHPAVIGPNGRLSYAELHRRAAALSRTLVETCQVQPQERVALMVDRNEWSIIGLMGILMAGGAYLPLDAAHPSARIHYILENSGCRLLLTDTLDFDARTSIPAAVTCIDMPALAPADPAATPVAGRRPAPDHLAYTIYTSGSTGRPKGVLIEHSGFINMVLDQIRIFGVSEDDRVLQFASASFDASLSEIFMALLAGAALVTAPKEIIYDTAAFERYLQHKRVTHVTLPPAYLNTLDKSALTTVTTLITAGEAPHPEDARLLSRSKRYFNAYGPTEISVCATIGRVHPYETDWRTIPIGRPIANTAVYVLDDRLQLVPVGVTGEICIAGPGLARGYLDQPDLTARKFVDHPFAADQRLYRTGDIGRWRRDGRLEWLGRNDNQIKINGHRIELDEVKNALLRHTAVNNAVVVAVGRPPQHLAAYYTAAAQLSADDLRAHLAAELPAPMVPGVFIPLADLPLTVHGKVDYSALPEPHTGQTAKSAGAAPRNPLEQWMLTLWREILANPAIGVHDNFFDAGGNSLRCLQLISRISTGSTDFQLGKIPVKQLFLHPTVAELCRAIQALPVKAVPKPVQVPERPGRASLPEAVRIVREPLIALFDAGRVARVDAAAIVCLPDEWIDGTGLSRQDLFATYFRHRPVLSSITSTFLGRIAAIILPCLATEMFSDKTALQHQVAEALAIAGHIGADNVALTGNLPLATDLGLDLDPDKDRPNPPAVTTGQATVAAAMGMTIERMLTLSDRRLDQETIGLVGVNTIGAATVLLMLSGMPHPRRIILTDAYNNLLLASLLRQEIKDCGFTGSVEIMRFDDQLPEAFYESSLIIGATNVSEIIAIDRIRPGTLIVEESGQRCFSRTDAWQRLRKHGDILFTEGDALRLPFAAVTRMYLPMAVETALRRNGRLDLLSAGPHAITGCILSSLLSHGNTDLEPTIGEVDGATALRHYHHLHRLGFRVAAPYHEGETIRAAAVHHFRQRFGNQWDTAVQSINPQAHNDEATA